MRFILLLYLALPFATFSQKISKATKSALVPANCIQLDSSTFIGQTEITNMMYHQFVDFVRDSIITHFLYDNLEDDQAVKFLAISKRELKNVLPENRAENLKRYSLN